MEQMMEDVCGYINNYFEREKHCGEFTISNKTISCDFLQNGQYFRIVNSVFNDGIHKYPATDLTDEVFSGTIWAMAVPPTFIALIDEIEAWQEKYGSVNSVAMSPFSSESFNNYSYSKSGSSRSGSGGNAPMSWSDVYGSKLDRWRKI